MPALVLYRLKTRCTGDTRDCRRKNEWRRPICSQSRNSDWALVFKFQVPVAAPKERQLFPVAQIQDQRGVGDNAAAAAAAGGGASTARLTARRHSGHGTPRTTTRAQHDGGGAVPGRSRPGRFCRCGGCWGVLLSFLSRFSPSSLLGFSDVFIPSCGPSCSHRRTLPRDRSPRVTLFISPRCSLIWSPRRRHQQAAERPHQQERGAAATAAAALVPTCSGCHHHGGGSGGAGGGRLGRYRRRYGNRGR